MKCITKLENADRIFVFSKDDLDQNMNYINDQIK